MHFERLKTLRATIQFRLIVWMILVVLVLVVLAMVAVRQIYRARFLDSFDKTLRGDVEPVTKVILDGYPDWARVEQNITRIALAHPLQAWFAEIYDEHGRKVAVGGFRDFSAPLRPIETADLLGAHDLSSYRVIATRVEPPGLPAFYLRNGADRRSLQEDLAGLDERMVVRSLLILLMAPIGGYVLALRATRPIAKIIAAATRLEPSRMQERLPIRGTGDELDQLSQTINGMLDRIGEYIDRNREFVANAAHELRSPLAAIRSSVEVALNRRRTPEEYDALLAEVMEECQYLGNLVNRLLILAEGDAGRLGAKDQTARLDKVVHESLDMFDAVAEQRGVQLQADSIAAALVPGDDYKLRQVVRNLLDNAIKFSPTQGGVVSVRLAVDAEKRHAVLTIQDQGAGIAPEDLPHIFDRFYRADKARQRQAGRHSSGLGLSICQTIVQALGGMISAANAPGHGATITVELPLAAEPTTVVPSRPEVAAPVG